MVSGCRASIFVPLPWISTSGRKHGSDALARLKRPCCGAAPFFFRRQARSSRQAVGVAPEALRLRCFLTNFLCKTSASWFVFLEGQDPWLRAKKLLLLVRRSPLNAACQLLYRSPLAVAPVLRNFAAGGPAALFLAPGLLSCAGREWKLALGSGSWVGGIEVETFDELCFEKIYVLKSLNPKP